MNGTISFIKYKKVMEIIPKDSKMANFPPVEHPMSNMQALE